MRDKNINLDSINKVVKVVIEDLWDFDDNFCHNGGKYSYTTIYHRLLSTEHWYVEYRTSAEFDFCPMQGIFMSCIGCRFNENGCWCKPKIIWTNEVLNEIKYALDSPDYNVIFD